jgi:hypothetical protein
LPNVDLALDPWIDPNNPSIPPNEHREIADEMVDKFNEDQEVCL